MKFLLKKRRFVYSECGHIMNKDSHNPDIANLFLSEKKMRNKIADQLECRKNSGVVDKESKRQSRLTALTDFNDQDLMQFIDSALEDIK